MSDIAKLSIADFTSQMRTVLDNIAANAEINAALTTFGYDAPRRQEGQTLLDNLTAADTQQVKEYADQLAASATVQQSWETADATYGLHRALAKRLFTQNVQAQRELLLNETKPRRRADWLRQANIFYTHLLGTPAFVTQMGQFGQTPAMLTAAQTAVATIATLDSNQQKETAEAQAATRLRDEAWAEARVWLVTLLQVARYALADQSQLLEALEIDR